jgi:hypothetical protein
LPFVGLGMLAWMGTGTAQPRPHGLNARPTRSTERATWRDNRRGGPPPAPARGAGPPNRSCTSAPPLCPHRMTPFDRRGADPVALAAATHPSALTAATPLRRPRRRRARRRSPDAGAARLLPADQACLAATAATRR